MSKKRHRHWKGQRGNLTSNEVYELPVWVSIELTPSEVALCMLAGHFILVIEEHLTEEQCLQMYKDIIDKKISEEELSQKEWRELPRTEELEAKAVRLRSLAK